MPAATDAKKRTRTLVRRCLLAAIAVLYAASIPWYREAGEMPDVVFGLPDWVAVALACYFGVAVLNAIAWLLTDVSDELDPRDDWTPDHASEDRA